MPLSKQGEPERGTADDLYTSLSEAGLDVLYDDRDANAGEKLTDAELIGCPLRVVVGKKSLAEGKFEVQVRKTGAEESIQVEGATDAITGLLDTID